MNLRCMAYRGDTTDPLENMINQRRGSNRMILWLALFFVVPSLFQGVFSVFQRALFEAPARSAPPTITAAPPATVAPARTAAAGTRISAGGTKMSAANLEQLLRTAPTSKQVPRDVRCTPINQGWDYVCMYQTDVPRPQTPMKIGVRVSANGVVQASAPQPLGTPLVSPQPLAR
jgi:hypothetical protein